MDPKTALEEADQAISDGDLSEAASKIEDYRGWRAKGGFQPGEVAGSGKAGDAFCAELERRLESARAQTV